MYMIKPSLLNLLLLLVGSIQALFVLLGFLMQALQNLVDVGVAERIDLGVVLLQKAVLNGKLYSSG